jgi:hypothetical protein
MRFEIDVTSAIGSSIFNLQSIVNTGTSAAINASGGIEGTVGAITVEYFPPQGAIYSKQCNNTDCESVLSARVVDSGASATVSNENLDFINGNCTNPSTGTYVCSFNSGVFSLAPNCEATIDDPRTIRVTSVSNTSVTIVTYNPTTAGVQDANGFSLMCQKQGVDYGNTRKIVGTFSEVVTAPGWDRPKTYKTSGGGAGSLAAPTVCTGSPCTEYAESYSGVYAAPTKAAVGAYQTVISNGTFVANSFLDCSCTAKVSSATIECNIYDGGNYKLAADANGGATIDFLTGTYAGVAANAYFTVSCTGQAP